MKYDFINADNVLEHVPDAETFLRAVSELCHDKTIVCMSVPNDFSVIQKIAYKNGNIDHAFWVTKETSEHINYFTVESLTKLGSACGFRKLTALADWPIDFFLLHTSSNYSRNADVGHECHMACVELENAMAEMSGNKRLNLHEAIADMGLGRKISVFFTLK